MERTDARMTIPLVDLAAQQAEVADEVRAGLRRGLRDDGLHRRPGRAAVRDGVRALHVAAGTASAWRNGTDALELAFRAVGVCRATRSSCPRTPSSRPPRPSLGSARCRYSSTSTPTHLLMDPSTRPRRDHARALRPIVPVHLFGQVAPVERAGRSSPPTRESPSSRTPPRRRGRVGTAGRPGASASRPATSFYPGKNLGAAGDAGAVHHRRRRGGPRRSGCSPPTAARRKYEHELVGHELPPGHRPGGGARGEAAPAGRWNERRRAAAARYDELLADVADVRVPGDARGQRGRVAPLRRPGRRSATACSPRCTPQRRRRRDPLPDAGPPHRCVRRPGYWAPARFPVAEAAAGRILSLPTVPAPHPRAAGPTSSRRLAVALA